MTVGLCYELLIVDGFVLQHPSDHKLHLPAARPCGRTNPSKSNLHNAEREHDGISTHMARNDTETLWSYVYNLQRARRDNDDTRANGYDEQIRKQALLKPARSLAYFLESHTYRNHDKALIVEPLQRAVVQAVRAASGINDYRLILQLLNASIHFATANDDRTAVLDTRIAGETISALSRTAVNINKIKAAWNKVTDTRTRWTRAVGSLEVNAMLQAFIDRGKVRVALTFFHEYICATDAYSISIVFNGLAKSITDSQKPTDNVTALENSELVPKLLASLSSCWQWNEAMVLLDSTNASDWNNPVLTSVLQLNERAAQVFPDHDGPARVIFLIDIMKEHRILPDQVTSTLILSNLGNAWETAIELLCSSSTQQYDGAWTLAPPNVYMYSAAMAVCARSRGYESTVKLLKELETSKDLQPNVWVYNSVLQALTTTRKRIVRNKAKPLAREQAKERLKAALELFRRMKVQPDLVTFNTLLAVAGSTLPLLQETEWCDLENHFPDFFPSPDYSHDEQLVTTLLDRMKERNIELDTLTYKHAIQAICEGPSILRLIRRARSDCSKHRAIEIYNAGLSILAEVGDFESAVRILSTMPETNLNSETTVHIINALGSAGMTSSLPPFFEGEIAGDDVAQVVASSHGVDLQRLALPPLDALHFSAAISCCLRVSDFESARRLLVHMRVVGVRPSPESLQNLAWSYAIIALEHHGKASSRPADGSESMSGKVPTVRARSAFSILSSIENPPVALVSIVAKACCSAGLIPEAQTLLRSLHKRVLHSRLDKNFQSSLRQRDIVDAGDRILPGLHRDLLRFCAVEGNVTNALRICEDIQYFSKQLATFTTYQDTQYPLQIAGEFRPNSYATVDTTDGLGMTATGWKSLLVAASKSNHWKVCLSTLQFLRPFLVATHPSKAQSKEERARLTEAYGRLESAMNTAVKCLAVRSQYAWIVRAIYDWIDWSGRRPPKEAVLAAVRVLSNRGRGEEVNSLLACCTTMESCNTKCDNKSYNTMLFVGAITALYNDGLYDEADDAFVAAVSQCALPFNVERQPYGAEKRITLDLHGMNLAVAHSAVRIALQQEAVSVSWKTTELWDKDMVIVTGRGLNSALKMRPVLRPAVQRMLVEEFYPPLNTVSVPGNLGAICIASEDISEWLKHQQQQKSARLLMVAAMLKNIASPGGRLRAAFSQAAGPMSV